MCKSLSKLQRQRIYAERDNSQSVDKAPAGRLLKVSRTAPTTTPDGPAAPHTTVPRARWWALIESQRTSGEGSAVRPSAPVASNDPTPPHCPLAEFKKRLRRWLPTAQTLEQTRGFGWMSHYLREHPRLWVLHRRGVALGVALGIGIGVFPLPLQMPAAMLAAVALRANVAAAAAATWLTNPFTMAPIWALAAFLGSFVVPQSAPVVGGPAPVSWAWAAPQTWPAALWEQVTSWGPALLAGFPLAGVVLGVAAYALVYWGWAVLIRQERRRRLASRPP